jgi:hypothetical protein
MDKILKVRLDVEKIMLGAAFVVEEHTVQLAGLGNKDVAVGDPVEVVARDDDTISADEEKDLVKPVGMQVMARFVLEVFVRVISVGQKMIEFDLHAPDVFDGAGCQLSHLVPLLGFIIAVCADKVKTMSENQRK